ncbi:hypothetical protein, partial [Flavobacterium sp.]|uniref:hypothetical protein n=1 Tax=Flavobacterium sp. TaxID=239 RepID=UPI0037514545
MRTKALYLKHREKACEPIERTKEEIEGMFGEPIEGKPVIITLEELGIPARPNHAIKTRNVKEATNMAIDNVPIVVEDSFDSIETRVIMEMGIMPVELFKDEALKLHLPEIVDMLDECANGVCTVEELVPNLFVLLFSNVESPHHINVIDNGTPPLEHYKIFNGLEYVKDFMTKDLRNSRFFQLMMYYFHNMTEVPMIEDKTAKFIKTILLPHIVKSYADERYHNFIQKRMVRNHDIIQHIGLERVNDKYSEFVRIKLGRVAPAPIPQQQPQSINDDLNTMNNEEKGEKEPYVPQPPLSYLVTKNHVLKHIADHLSYEMYMMESLKLLRDKETEPIQ